MSLLDELRREEVWQDLRADKKEHNQLSKRELKELDLFIEEKKYLSLAETFSFDYPVRKTITKLGSDKKRTVYVYSAEETWILKLLAYLLYKYDDKITDNCYSFRRNMTAKVAFDNIRKISGLDERWVLKTDIHDYFNSIDVEQLLAVLKEVIDDDPQLLSFLTELLRQDKCWLNGELIEEKRGAMAGVPLASFFANVYLMSLDKLFADRGIPYFRYSDDIIIFLESEEELKEGYQLLIDHIGKKKLTLNEKKTETVRPHEPWSFLGFCYRDGKIDLAKATVEKMKGKIRRKARSLYRYRARKDADFDKVARIMIRSFDLKFYDLTGNNDFTWTRFYFPVLTTSEGLREIDEYLVRYLRYLYSGRQYKGNYKVTYEHLKELGYTSLVNEFYRWRRDNRKLDEENADAYS